MLIWFLFLGIFVTSCSSESETNKGARLPELHISGKISDLNLGDYSKAEITWFDANGTKFYEEKVKWRYRGNRSFNFPKKSYSIKLKKSESFLGLPKSRKWKLNADYIDKTKMRNKISYDLFRSFSEGNFAPQVAYFKLFLNKKNNGVYALIEAVDEHSLGFNMKDPKAVLFKEPPLRRDPSEHEERFRKFQKYSATSDRYNKFSDAARQKLINRSYFNQRYPNVTETNFSDEIVALTEFISTSPQSEFSDPAIFNRYFDLDNIIDWHLLILVTNNGDGFHKNYYFSRKSAGAPFLFTPWDYDHSFGREGDGEVTKETIVNLSKMPLLNRLMETNPFNYRQRLYDKFMALKKKGVLTVSHLHEMIDANKAVIQPSMKENSALWPLQAVDFFKGASFNSEVQFMKDWVVEHLPRLEAYLAEEINKPVKTGISIIPIIPEPDGARPVTSEVDLEHHKLEPVNP